MYVVCDHSVFRAMSVGNEDAMAFFRGDEILCYLTKASVHWSCKCCKSMIYTCCTVPELRADYSFGEGGRPRMGKRDPYTFPTDGGRPRMGKREPAEETDDLMDGGKVTYCMLCRD